MEWPFDPAQLAQVFCVRAAATALVDKVLQLEFIELCESWRFVAYAIIFVSAKNEVRLIYRRHPGYSLPGRMRVTYFSVIHYGFVSRTIQIRSIDRTFPSVYYRLIKDAPRKLTKDGYFALLHLPGEADPLLPRVRRFMELTRLQDKIWSDHTIASIRLAPNRNPAIRERLIALGHDCYFVARLDDNCHLSSAELNHCRLNGKPRPPRQVYTSIFHPPLQSDESSLGVHYHAMPGSWVIVGESGLIPMDFRFPSLQCLFTVRVMA